jgi:hypothetical protein
MSCCSEKPLLRQVLKSQENRAFEANLRENHPDYIFYTSEHNDGHENRFCQLYSFDDANAAERRETQYFEMLGNRGIYHKGWTAVTRHRTPWIVTGKTPPFDDDVWELYDTNKDWSQAHDLSKEMPEKLHELQRLWIIQATRNNVLPMDDRAAERFNSDLAGRPVLVRGKAQILAGGMGGLNVNGLLNIKNKSHSLTARVIVPEGKPCEGVILSQGGFAGGWIFYVKEGRPTYCYNFAG